MTDASYKKRRIGCDFGGPTVPQQVLPVLASLTDQNRKLEEQLLSVELIGKHGKILWKCDDLRVGHEQKLQRDVDTPSYEETGACYWRKNVWTLPVAKRKVHEKKSTELVLTKADQIKEVRVGLTKWKADIGRDVGLDFEYDKAKQILKFSLPIVETATRKLDDIDALGKNGLYLSGIYKVTGLDTLNAFEDPEDPDYHGHGFDKIRDDIPDKRKFSGAHDELVVEHVHLAISGALQATLRLYNLYNEEKDEEFTFPW